MKTNLEQSLLRLFVYFSIGYQLIQLVYDFLFTDYVMFTQMENAITALLYLLIVFFASKSASGHLNALWIYLVSAASLTFEWLFFGGFDSSMPYNAILLMMVILICSRGRLRIWSASLFCMLILALLVQDYTQWVPAYDTDLYPSNFTLTLDFLLHGLLIALVTLVLKQKFDNYRIKIGKNNEELKQIDQEIALKNQDLASQQREIQLLNANLEQLIEQEIQKIKEKNHKLAEYAHINAHHLRGPLCRIMGLVELMEETTPEDKCLPNTIRERADELDEIIKQINNTVS